MCRKIRTIHTLRQNLVSMKITKASGEQQTYSRIKFCRSLRKSGATKEVIDRVCREVEKELKPGVSTDVIFQKASRRLRKESSVLAAKYSLKRGIMELGPAGFLFEQYVAAILREYGYETKTNKIMRGRCVSHEIDVVAFYKNKHYLMELKYHNSQGIKTDLKVIMYMQARLEDIAERQKQRESFEHTAWLFTNTKFTSKAIAYGECRGVKMTGWKYPKKESLEQFIEQKALYPVTVLPSVNAFVREQFAFRRILFARDLASLSLNYMTKRLGIYERTAKKILQEARELTL